MRELILVDPPTSSKFQTAEIIKKGRVMPSLGLLEIASVARNTGLRVKLIGAVSLGIGIEDTVQSVIKESPKYLGLTATTISIFSVAEIARRVKEKEPDIIIIVGGPHLTAIPEETMSLFPAIDIGVIGEGEETFKDLIQTLEANGDLSKVAGIIYRKGKLLSRNQLRPFIQNIDTVPFPAWDIVDNFPNSYNPAPGRFLKLPVAPMVSSRGCPYQCNFCDRSIFGNKCRVYSALYVLDLIKYLTVKFGVREILFEDDTFVTFKKRLVEICEGLIREKMNLSWSCLGRADAVDFDMLKLMKRAGCWRISYGIETGDQKVMDFIGKSLSLEKVEKALLLTKKAGILTKGFFILGHPIDDADTINKTIKFALKAKLDDINVNMMTPFPGSKLYEIASSYGQFENDWKKMDLLNVVFVPKRLTKEQLEYFCKEMMRKFYLRPSKIVTYIIRILKNPMTVSYYIKGLASFLRQYVTRLTL